MPLSDWSSPIETNELECKKLKKTLRKKVTDHRQFDSILSNKEDDDELADFVPNAVLTKVPEKTAPPPPPVYTPTLYEEPVATPQSQPQQQNPLRVNPSEQYTLHPQFMQYAAQKYKTGVAGRDDILTEKINYVIRLLEEQKDEKTNHVTEELILYAFLGIFVIFVLDSFVKKGRYVR